MLPILLNLGPVKIYSYGVCLAIGLFISLYFWWKMGRDEHWDEILLFDGFFLSVIVYLVFGRIGYVLSHIGDTSTIYRSIAILAYPGLNAVFGIVAVIIFMVLFARAQGWQVWKASDAFVVALSIILVFGGLGGLLNGSNPGRLAPWGLIYPGQTGPRIPVDAWILLWAIPTFATVSRVRKNFRFYSWYKGDSSMAQEGLASLVFVLLVGIYYGVLGWIGQTSLRVGKMPGEFLIGVLVIAISTYLINRRVGRREDTVWGKLSNIIRRK